MKKWLDQFTASDVAGMINNPSPNEDEQTLREYLLPGALPSRVLGKIHRQEAETAPGRAGPQWCGARLSCVRENQHIKQGVYGVKTIAAT